MQKLTIRNFGPLSNCEVNVKDFTVLIGPSSSGKSTISKLVFFFLHIREASIQFILHEIENSNNIFRQDIFIKYIRKRFVEFWGPMPHDKDLFLKFEYAENVWVEIHLDAEKHKFITPKFSKSITDLLNTSYDEIAKGEQAASSPGPGLFTTLEAMHHVNNKQKIIKELKTKFGLLFNFTKELFFIPAGRSLLSTISDQLQYIHPHQLDYPMRQFIERINATKSFFNKSLIDIVNERRFLEDAITYKGRSIASISYIKKILNAEFRHDNEGSKLFLGSNKFTKISFASSGQQESIWILLSLFLVILENVDAFIFIEEPEAHLFPIAQKEIISFICYVANIQKCQFMVTTHSPYIISTLNNHIYASSLGKNHHKAVSSVIPANEWLNHTTVNGYFLSSGQIQDLYDPELNVFKAELVDSASEITNRNFDDLFSIESSNQQE